LDAPVDDVPSFSHQRRNVMWLSCLIILICVVGANLDKFTVFGIEPKHPKLIMWVLVVVLLYFVWRYFQVSQDTKMREQLKNWYNQYLIGRLKKKARTIARAELRLGAQQDAKRDHTEPPNGRFDVQVKVIDGAATDAELKYPRAQFVYEGSATWIGPNDGAQSITRKNSKVSFDLSTASKLWIKTQAIFLVTFSKIAFTEYMLPYMLAVTALGCVVWRYH